MAGGGDGGRGGSRPSVDKVRFMCVRLYGFKAYGEIATAHRWPVDVLSGATCVFV